jgi:uncharacterized protein YukE
MSYSVEQIKAAQVRWELNLVILQEEERRSVNTLEEYSRTGAAVPKEAFERLRAARTQCNDAFQALMTAIEHSATRKDGPCCKPASSPG